MAVWTGWVGLGTLAGFGRLEVLPGITSWTIDTRITLPLGAEAYAVYALHHATSPATPRTARVFAAWSSAAAFALGLAAQIAYHLLAAGGVTHAPWPVTVLVSSVLVLAIASAAMLWHLLGRPDPVAATPAATPLAAEASTPATPWPDVDPLDDDSDQGVAVDRPATWPPVAQLYPAPLGELARLRARQAFPLPPRPAARPLRPPLALVDDHPPTTPAEDDVWTAYDRAQAAGQPWTWRELADALDITPDAARGRARRRTTTPGRALAGEP